MDVLPGRQGQFLFHFGQRLGTLLFPPLHPLDQFLMFPDQDFIYQGIDYIDHRQPLQIAVTLKCSLFFRRDPYRQLLPLHFHHSHNLLYTI